MTSLLVPITLTTDMGDKDGQPAFRVFSHIPREGKDDYWLNIGLAFPHQDGKGFNVMLLGRATLLAAHARSSRLRRWLRFNRLGFSVSAPSITPPRLPHRVRLRSAKQSPSQ